jgi:hypothetical protein
MKGHSIRLFRLSFLILAAFGSVSLATAQQGQYYVSDAPFNLPGLNPHAGLLSYAPIKSIDGQKIVLKGDDRQAFTFTLDPETTFCEGGRKTSDWTYLKRAGKKTITVMTRNDAEHKAIVVWDQAPSISSSNGVVLVSVPPLCK